MRKVIIFALILAIALGGIGFAHAAVTESQDDLKIYPILETGDSAALDGLSAQMTFNCGEHLFWNSTHTFGSCTDTEFVYDREGIPEDSRSPENHLDIWLSGGTSASTSGSFSILTGRCGNLFRAVANQTPNGGSQTMTLKLADYMDYYFPEFSLYYRESNRQCIYQFNLMDLLEKTDSFSGIGMYDSFFTRFRFPVEEDQTVSVTLTKDDMGRICSFDLYPENGPELYFASHLGSEGIWFVPIFRDEKGQSLSYESPEGHGVYFVPWKVTDTYDTQVYVAPDPAKVRRIIPLEESLPIDQIEINGATNECRLLSREGDRYILSFWDLTTGAQKLRLEVLPHDPDHTSMGSFIVDNGLLLVTAGGNLALVDPEQGQVLLTAPDMKQQRYFAYLYNAELGDLRFDGQRLYLLNPVYSHNEGAFWTAVWQEGECLYYGEYDCSLLRGNDSWYYSSVGMDLYPIQWK